MLQEFKKVKQNHQNAQLNAENPKIGSSWAGSYLQIPQF